jgi:hypothetical protein
MNEPEAPRPAGGIRHPEVTYDTSDLSARGVFLFLVFLAVGGTLLAVSLWGVYKYIANVKSVASLDQSPLSTPSRELAPIGGSSALKFPAPRLQPDPVADMNAFRASEEETLNSYGWVDESAGKVHIPIERAIDLLSAVGLPVRQDAPAGKE